MPSQSSYFSNNNSDTNHIFYSSCSHFFLSLRFFSYAHHTVLSVRAQLTSKAVPLGRSQKDPLDQLFLSCVTHIGSVGSFMHPLSQQTLEEFTGSHATGYIVSSYKEPVRPSLSGPLDFPGVSQTSVLYTPSFPP